MRDRMHITLAQTLISLGHDRHMIGRAADEYYASRRFGEWLVEHGAITDIELQVALIKQRLANKQATMADVAKLRELRDRQQDTRHAAVMQLAGAVAR